METADKGWHFRDYSQMACNEWLSFPLIVSKQQKQKARYEQHLGMTPSCVIKTSCLLFRASLTAGIILIDPKTLSTNL